MDHPLVHGTQKRGYSERILQYSTTVHPPLPSAKTDRSWLQNREKKDLERCNERGNNGFSREREGGRGVEN